MSITEWPFYVKKASSRPSPKLRFRSRFAPSIRAKFRCQPARHERYKAMILLRFLLTIAALQGQKRVFSLLSGNCRSFEPPGEFSHIDDDPGMPAGPDLLAALGCPDGELDLAPVNFCHLGFPVDNPSNGCRREMADVDGRTDRALARIEISPDCVEGG